MLAWLSTKLGSAPELLRLPSMIAGTLSIPLVYLLGARAVSRSAGLIAAAVMALSPFMIFYSGDGRTYAVAIALLLGTTLAMLAAARAGRARWWVLYGVLTALAMYTHYTSAFILGAQLLWLLWAHPEARRPALVANLGAVVLFAPWIPSMLADFDSPTIEILSALQGDGFAIKRLAVESWAYGYPYVLPQEVPGRFASFLIVIALAAAAVVGLLRWRAAELDRKRRFPPPSKGIVLVLALALATPVAELLILGLTGNDLFGARNLNTSSAGLSLAIGAVLASAGPIAGTACVVAVLTGFSIGAARTLRAESEAIRFDQAAELIEEQAGPGDVVLDALSAAITPVPLTPLEIYLDQPPSKPLFFPTGEPPYLPFVSDPPPANPIFRQAFREAGEHRVFLVASDVEVSEAPPGEPASITDLGVTEIRIELPPGARIVEQERYPGVRAINVFVIQPDPVVDGRSG